MTELTSVGVQQSQALTYNHPCGDLLQGGRRREYLEFCVPLYKASIQGDWEAASVILKSRECLVRHSITEYKETPLHIAAAAASPRTAQSIKFVRLLVDMMRRDDLKLQNEDGNTALCIATISRGVEMAMIMVRKNPELLTIRGSNNMMPLHLAASYGNYKMVRYLYEHSQRMTGDGWTNDERDMVFLKCIQADIVDVALKMLDDNTDIQFPQEKHLCHVLDILARKTKVFAYPEGEPHIWRVISQIYLLIAGAFGLSVTDLNPRARKGDAAILLVRKIWKNIMEKPKNEIDAILEGPMTEKDGIETYPSPILFIAAEKGNKRFLVELLNEYPELVLKTNDDGHTIFHIAALHGHKMIYNLFNYIGSLKDRVIQLIDKKGNNMLHLLAMNAGRKEKRLASASQLQRRFLWFKEVKAMLPPRFIEMANEEDLTPIQVFAKSHEDLFSKGEKWTKDTINQSMVVATLIATIGFAAAFTIPGGYNQDSGLPMFLQNKYFTWFVMMDAISFISSSVSILVFLSLIISPSSQHGSVGTISYTVVFGLVTLFISIVTLMSAFSASFLILYDYRTATTVSFLVYITLIVILLVEVKFFVDASNLRNRHWYLLEYA